MLIYSSDKKGFIFLFLFFFQVSKLGEEIEKKITKKKLTYTIPKKKETFKNHSEIY